jgi:hypothetical protein
MNRDISKKFLRIKPVEGKNYTHLQVLVHYMKGKNSPYVGQIEGGIKLSVNAAEVRGNLVIITHEAFTVARAHLKDAQRWSDKFYGFTPDPEKEAELVNLVLKRMGTELLPD